MQPWVTAFGSPAGQQALGLLRALASRYGIALRPTCPLDAAAAVVAGHLWVKSTGVASFSDLDAAGGPARESLSLVLCRAAGLRAGPGPGPAATMSDTADLYADVDVAVNWLLTMFGTRQAVSALRAAASDLVCDDSVVASAGVLLSAAADSLEAAVYT